MSAAIAPIAGALFESLHPLVVAAENPDYRRHLLRQLGWDENAAAELFVLGPQFVEWWKRGTEHQTALAKAIDAKDGEAQFLQAMLLLEIAFELSDAIAARQGKPSDGPLEPGVREALWKDLAVALPEYLLLRWLRLHQPVVYWLLRITDVVEIDTVDGNGPARVPAQVPRLRTSRIGPLLSETETYLKGRYDWGFDRAALEYSLRHDQRAAAPMRHDRLLAVLHRFFTDVGLQPGISTVRERYVADAGKNVPGGVNLFDPTAKALGSARQLSLPLVRRRTGAGPWQELGLDILPLPGSRGQDTIDGLYITNLARGGHAGSFVLDDAWTLKASPGLEASGAVGVRILPGQVTVEGTAPASTLEFRFLGYPALPWVLMGSNTGTRLELRGAETGIAFEHAGQDVEIRLFYEPKAKGGGPGMVLILAPGEGDGVVKQLLGDTELEIIFDIGFDWSSLTGLRLAGEAGVCITLPLNLPIGPITINELHLCLSAGPEGISLVCALTAAATLGPVVCSVNEIGIEFQLAWDGAGQRQTFGALSLDAGFKPPSGVGLGIETAAVRAGGYLEFNRELAEYGGTATVGIGPLALTAVGLLNARLPEPPGWSLLLIICADFTPVPLGFGFTLNGVGGLIGIGRSINSSAIRRTLAAGALDAVMFPEDPVTSGPAIIDTIRDLFPVAQGQTVFGPMVKIGWGAPALIEADLAVLIELPDPICVVIIGQIASELPTKQVGLIKLHLDSMGEFNLTELSLAIDAALYDSWIVGFTLAGSLAIRASFGPAPTFLFSLGGFHPAFKAPRGFPPMKPLSIGLDFGEDLKIEARSYLALTSNMIQYGARVDIVARLRILTLEGGAGFDVLVNFSPFSFVADFEAHVLVMVGSKELLGVAVTSKLSGPEPWFFSGTATFEVLYKDWSVDVQLKLAGKQTPIDLDTIDVAALVRAALLQPGAWSQVGAGRAGVQLVQLQAAAAGQVGPNTLPSLTLRPDLDVELRQRVAPLGVEMDKYGNHEIAGSHVIGIDQATFGSAKQTTQQLVDVEDWFAPAEYFNLTKNEKLDGPSFDQMAAGKRITVGGFAPGAALDRSLTHECSVIDRDLDRKLARTPSPRKARNRPSVEQAVSRYAAKSALARRPRRFQAAAPAVTMKAERWRVIDIGSSWRSAEVRTFTEARQLMNRRQRDQSYLKGRLRTVPVVEAER
jgi:hypothetical protein